MVKKNNKVLLIISLILILISFSMVLLSLRTNPFSNRLNAHDSSMFIYFGRGIKDGMIPYNEMFDHKGIILFFVQYLGIFLGNGNDNLGIWIIEVLFFSVTTIFFLKMGKLITKDIFIPSIAFFVICTIGLHTFEGGNLSEEFALPFISIALYFFVKIILTNRYSRMTLFLIGLTGGIIFFIRSNMIALWIVFCLFLLIKNTMVKNYPILLEQICFIFLGGITVCSGVLTYGFITESLNEMIYQTFILNFQYSSILENTSPVSPNESFLDFVNRSGVLVFISLFFMSMLYRDKKDPIKTLSVIIVIYMLFNYMTVIMSGRFYLHYFTTMLPILFILTVIGLYWFSDIMILKNKPISIILLFLIVPLFSFYVGLTRNIIELNTIQPSEYTESAPVEVAQFIEENSDEDEPIYVHNINANIYNLSDRYSNSRFFVLPSLNYEMFANLLAEFKNDFKNCPPKFVVVKKDVMSSSWEDDEKLNKYVQKVLQQEYAIEREFDQQLLLFEKQENE